MTIKTIEENYVARHSGISKNGTTDWIFIVPKKNTPNLSLKEETTVTEGINLVIKSQQRLDISYVENEEDKLIIAGYYCLNLPVGDPNGILNI